MFESIHIADSLTKEKKYQELLPQLKGLTEGESDLVANLANLSAALHSSMHFFWVGFYFVKNNQLVLGPFQGTVACTRIDFGKGVCGKAWETKQIQMVDDVDGFPGHIACSSLSRSEIVLPIFNSKKEVVMVLDIDSDKLADFDETDKKYLQEVILLIEKKYE